MRFITSIATATVVALPLAFAAPGPFNFKPGGYWGECVDTVDVVIIGGGGTGVYSAIQLKDKGKKVMVVESKGRLGGHTETYIDPETKRPIDIGVKLYHNEPIVKEWFTRFNLSTSNYDFTAATAGGQNVDFRTGKILQGLPAANQTALAAALQRYAAAISKYPQLDGGFYLPDPVPEELYMPFGQFVQKYDLTDAVQLIGNLISAFGDILELPTVQVIRTMSLSLVATIQDFQTSSVMDNSLLFEKATTELLNAKSLLLNSRVLATQRVSSTGGVKVLVDSPNGRHLIIAKKILITIPPTPSALAAFDTNQEELSIFSQLTSVGYYTSIIRHAAPTNDSITNLALDQPYALAPMPAIYNVAPTVNPSLFQVYYGTKLGGAVSDDQAKSAILADLKRYQTVNGLTSLGEPEFVVFSNHSPYNLMATGNATKAGFYKKMYALQGKRNTWWTGAAWRAHDSTASWKFTKTSVLPGLMAGL